MKFFAVKNRYAAIFLMIVCSFVVLAQSTEAANWSWTAKNPIVDSKPDAGREDSWLDECELMLGTVTAEGLPVAGTASPETPKTKCLLGEGNGYKVYTFNNLYQIAIQFSGEGEINAIGNVNCSNYCAYLPARDVLVRVVNFGGKIEIFHNFVKNIDRKKVYIGLNKYNFTAPAPDKTMSDTVSTSDQYVGSFKHLRASDNGKWLALEVVGAGLFRYDMDTGEMLKFSDWETNYEYSGPTIEFAISDDGQHIVVAGRSTINSIFDITGGCGEKMPAVLSQQILHTPQTVPCAYRSLGVPVGLDTSATIPNFRDATMPKFSADGGELSFFARSEDAAVGPRFVTMHADGYTPQRLEYLALGDSYSSGEGDAENNAYGVRYYRQDTGGKDGCHLSTRSYPYKLAAMMQLTISTQWNSVTCSGATAWDVKAQGSNAYLGQNNRLKGLSAESLKAQALNEFIPGRQKQIEFVKKYRPKTITLTMGGNDVGFAGLVQRCITGIDICISSNAERNKIRGQLLNQFGNLKDLYVELYEASGKQAKIYVVGYPNFVKGDGLAICGANVALMDRQERNMMQDGVILMNNVIKQAARAAGVKYIDIENSLDGHRLCDIGNIYVIGINDPLNKYGNRQESFHPNADGHQLMYTAMQSAKNLSSKTPLDYDNCPSTSLNICPDKSADQNSIEIPQYFQVSSASDSNSFFKELTSKDSITGQQMRITTGTYTFGSNSIVKVSVHSDPTDLGEFTTNADGSLDISPVLPRTIPVGYHTLYVEGETYSGEKIVYEQPIIIRSDNPNDLDADGINDAVDKCMLVPESGTDVDKDGTDDACDGYIGDPPATPSPSPSPTPTPNPQGGNSISKTLSQILAAIVGLIKLVVNAILKIFG